MNILNQQIPVGCPVMGQPVVCGVIFVCYDSQPSGWMFSSAAGMRCTANASGMTQLCSEAPLTASQHWKQQEILDFFIRADSKKMDQ